MKSVPTTENLARELDRRLRSQLDGEFCAEGPRLEMVRIRETERNICEIWQSSDDSEMKKPNAVVQTMKPARNPLRR